MPMPLRPRVPLSSGPLRPKVASSSNNITPKPAAPAQPPQPGHLGGTPSTFGGAGHVGGTSAIGNIGARLGAAGVRGRYGAMANAAGTNTVMTPRGPNAPGAPPIQQQGVAGAAGPGAPGRWNVVPQGGGQSGAWRMSGSGAWEQNLPHGQPPPRPPETKTMAGTDEWGRQRIGTPETPRGLQNPANKQFPLGQGPAAPRASITGLQTPFQASSLGVAEQQTQTKQGATANTAGSQIQSTASGLTAGEPPPPASPDYNSMSDYDLQQLARQGDQAAQNTLDQRQKAGMTPPHNVTTRDMGNTYEDADGRSYDYTGTKTSNGEQIVTDSATGKRYKVEEDATGNTSLTPMEESAQDIQAAWAKSHPGQVPQPGDEFQTENGQVYHTDDGTTWLPGRKTGTTGTQPGSAEDRINQLLEQAGRPPQGPDRAGLDAMKSANEAQFAHEAAKAMRAGLVASARGGMSPEAQSGMLADVGEQGGLAAQAANAQAELEFGRQKAAANLAHYQQQMQALQFAASMAADKETQAKIMRQQMLMAQYSTQAAKDLAQFEHELNKPKWYDYLLGGLGTAVGAGGTVLGGYFAGGRG